ncbi:MAG: SDR family oxidoreductase [Nevskia sp.]|nr:SDR family oxidoreductase [Nevskia sp.]
MGRVQDKVAIITGAASGVGKEDAILLAKEGARVVLTDLNEEAGRAVAASIGEQALFVRHDISSEDDWKAVMQAAESKFGGVDVLVNNAGILQAGSIEDTTLEQWRTVQRVNSDGYFLGCKYGVLAMKQRKSGSIVNMSSISAIVGMSAFCAYSASKGAVAALTRNVAIHARRFDLKIRCNSIHPDGIKTPMVANLHATAKPGQMAEVKDIKQQMSRMADAKDIANVVLFLASDESRFINGAEIHVDNGWRIWAER